ncbi:MAG: HAMP domain-containing histidine kinase, partial [Solirubrobacterales bacterium]|nr:HAMP domain-containing histidine kinase [Solirubrobacterales bacterium]
MSARLSRVALAVAAAVAVSAVAWPVYGPSAFLTSAAILAPLGAVTMWLAHGLASHRDWIGGIRGRLGALAVLAAAQLVVAVGLFAVLMFVSNHDAFFMALVAAYAALIGVGAAHLVAGRTLSDLDSIRAALRLVAEGAREVRIPVHGSSELAELAADVEAMVEKVSAEERARRRLVAAVSHDLRTPLTTLRLVADGLED